VISCYVLWVIDLAMDPDAQGVAWRKSRQSMNNGNCVEVAGVPNGIAVRDSANEGGGMLRYSTQTWRAFLAKAKIGKFDVKTELTGTPRIARCENHTFVR
jgi:Domain of unknown function (DUF397)